MSKKLVLRDTTICEDKAHISGQRGRVIVKIKGTDKVLFEKWNKVIIAGSAFTASKHFPNMVIPIKTPSYNEALGLENIMSLSPTEERNCEVLLFSVGIDGCGPENSQIYEPDYTKWCAPKDLVPFRYQLTENDLNSTFREKYFGRKPIEAEDRVAYYFKAFDTEPVFRQQYVDGTQIDENVYNSENTLHAESYVEMKMSVTKEDCRDYFFATTGIMDARINTISLLTAYPKIVDGYTYYQNIKPLTKLNFSNIALNDLTLGIDIIYQIYY